MQWETLKGEAGGVQRFSSCQQISLKEQNAAFFFLRHSWCITDISALLHLQDDGVCMRLVNYKSGTKLHVWWRLFPHVSFSLLCLVHMSTGGCWEFNCVYILSKENMFVTVSHVVFFASMWLDCIQMSKLALVVLRAVQTHNSSSPQQAFRRTFCRLPDGMFRERTSSIHCNIGVTLLDITWIV